MSNKYSVWTAILLAGLSNIAHGQSIPEPKSSLVPIGKAQPAAITPVKPAATMQTAPTPALVVLSPANSKLGTQAKLVTTTQPKPAPQATVTVVPAKLATQAKVVAIPAKAVTAAPTAVAVAVPGVPAANQTLQPVTQAKPQAMSLAAAGAVAGRSGAATISEIAANQASALARAAAIKTTPPVILPPMPAGQIVPELTPGTPIPVLTTSVSRARTPPPPRPYIAAIIGLKGQEIVEVQPGDGNGYTLRVGDSIQNWSIIKIAEGQVHMATTEYSKKKRTSESKSKIVAVGDSL